MANKYFYEMNIWIKQLILNNYEKNVKLIIDYWEFIRKIMLCIVYQYVLWLYQLSWRSISQQKLNDDEYYRYVEIVMNIFIKMCMTWWCTACVKMEQKMDLIMKQSIEDVLSIL